MTEAVGGRGSGLLTYGPITNPTKTYLNERGELERVFALGGFVRSNGRGCATTST